MNHTSSFQPEPQSFGFALSAPVDPRPPFPDADPLSESDFILASSALQEVSALHDQPELERVAARLRRQADQARIGLGQSGQPGEGAVTIDGAAAREHLRMKALWEGRLQVLNMVLRFGLIAALAWTIWENHSLKEDVRQLRENGQLLAESILRLTEEVREQR